MSNEIKYASIASIDIEAAMKSSQRSTSAERTKTKNDSTVWNQVVSVVMENADLNALVRGTTKDDIKKIRETIAPTLEQAVCDAITIPEKGKDRNGKEITLKKDDGSIKWSSWEQTRRMWAYLGDIAKVLAFSQESLLYPEQYKVAARCDILKECKESKPTIELVRQFTKNLQAQLDCVSGDKEIDEAHNLVQSLAVNDLDIVKELRSCISRMDALLGVAEAQDKQSVQQDLLQVAVKHFEEK